MRRAAVAVTLGLASWVTACASGGADPEGGASPWPPYLPRAHSHNDYERGRPLLDAVERGFASVEVDVLLVDGRLYVAHDEEDIRPAATLRSLYLDPLRELAARRRGWIYGPGDPSLQLLIDVKTDADETYPTVDAALSAYDDILTEWSVRGRVRGPVTAVLSGNRALRLIAADTLRYVAIDGRLEDDRSVVSTDAMPLVSVDWEQIEASPAGDRLEGAQRVIDLMHQEGRKVRFWGTPDREELWASLHRMGADYIGTDDPAGLHRVLGAVERLSAPGSRPHPHEAGLGVTARRAGIPAAGLGRPGGGPPSQQPGDVDSWLAGVRMAVFSPP